MCLIGIYILYLSVNNKYEMRPIFLIGYMGSGKTTLGRALGRRLGLQFIDLDLYIESRYMRTISQLFAERGEYKFRSIEREMLHEVAEMEDVVVACGGGKEETSTVKEETTADVETVTIKLAHNMDFVTIPEAIVKAADNLNAKYEAEGKKVRLPEN